MEEIRLTSWYGKYPIIFQGFIYIPVGGKNISKKSSTLPTTNIAPESRPSQEETHLPTIHFQGLC